MTNKTYIVANEQQEREVLEKLEREGLVWIMGGEKPTEWVPSRDAPAFINFPIVLIDKSEHDFDLPFILTDNSEVSLGFMYKFEDEEIVFDGRKEEHMSEKYVVSQVFMNELKGWKHDLILEDAFFVNQEAINNMPKIIKNWWVDDDVTIGESNKRLISIIRYMSGANDFEVEKPKKWVVRSKERNEQGNHLYTYLIDSNGVKDFMTGWTKDIATKFDTKEEAESWANSHQEVVEVDE